MINDDLVKCPLCHGFAHIENPELLAALRDPRLRMQVEKYVAQLLNAPLEELVNAAAEIGGARLSEGCSQLESVGAHVAKKSKGVNSFGQRSAIVWQSR